MAEDTCGIYHSDLQHAIACARGRLGLTREAEHPLVGNKKNNRLANLDQIIGFTDATGLKRRRVDWDPIKKVHVNEEDFSGPGASRKVCHTVFLSSEEWVIRWWKKFTSAGIESYKNKPVPRQKRNVLDEA
jgi:hypothetical protein